MSQRYQIVCDFGNAKTASLKAPSDVSRVADSLGFNRLTMQEKGSNALLRFVNRFITINKIEKLIENNSIVLLQYPIYYKSSNIINFIRNLKEKKHCKIVVLYHDINSLREDHVDEYERRMFDTVLNAADACIVHNEIMKQYLENLGYSNKKIISLEVFDYLYDCEKLEEVFYKKSIIIAGNLDTKKASYISDLGKLESLHFDLYGINFDDALADVENIDYHGSYPSEMIPQKLNHGFGLVWDGDSIDTCSGLTGEYLKINNPHKLSLYLLCGIPVVIWNSAAEAEFVKKHKVGICVDSLAELETKLADFSEEDYDWLLQNVKKLQGKLATGYYATKALTESVSWLTNN